MRGRATPNLSVFQCNFSSHYHKNRPLRWFCLSACRQLTGGVDHVPFTQGEVLNYITSWYCNNVMMEAFCFLPSLCFPAISRPFCVMPVFVCLSLCLCVLLGMASGFPLTCQVTATPAPNHPINLLSIQDQFNLPGSAESFSLPCGNKMLRPHLCFLNLVLLCASGFQHTISATPHGKDAVGPRSCKHHNNAQCTEWCIMGSGYHYCNKSLLKKGAIYLNQSLI